MGYIGRKQGGAVAAAVPKIQKERKSQLSPNLVKLQLDFNIRSLVLDVEESERRLFCFQLQDLSARLTVKNYNLEGEFGIGGCLAQQVLSRLMDCVL